MDGQESKHLKVVPFVPRPNPYKDDAVRVLKEMLAIAQEGGMHGVVIAYSTPDGGLNGVNSDSEHLGMLIGSLELMKFRILRAVECLDDEEEPDDAA